MRRREMSRKRRKYWKMLFRKCLSGVAKRSKQGGVKEVQYIYEEGLFVPTKCAGGIIVCRIDFSSVQ